MIKRPALLWLSASIYFAAIAHAQVYDAPEQAQQDPDFALQGEYSDAARGLQAIAMGEGAFNVVIYTGGLPGAGWNGKDKQTLEVDVEQLESMLQHFRRVERKSPTSGLKPPADALVLFDGTKASLDKHWQRGARISEDGLLMEGCTSVETFGDYSMHLEFRLPFMPTARGQARGNSGLYHQGRFETQVLDSFGLEGKNNEAGGLYSIRDPDLNMCLPPMAWQTYDVDFTAARYDADGNKTANARITVKLNGVTVHRDVELPHSTTAAPFSEGPEEGPIHLQNHGNPVRFRNIWVRPRDIDAEARRPLVPGFERFHGNGVDPIDGGRLLIGELNCVACHQTESRLVHLISPKQAPILDKVGERLRPEWLIEFISNPHQVKPGTTMPDLMSEMNALQRSEAAIAITNFLVGTDSIKSGGERGDSREGERLFHESGCVACHSPRDGRSTSATTSVPLPDLGKKYTRVALEEFLKNPLATRPSGRMPAIDLGGNNWRHVAQYLTGDLTMTFSEQRDFPKEPNLRFSAYYIDVDKLPNLDELEADKTGVSRGLDISVGERDENVVLRFSGYLPIKKSGDYTFRLSSDDGSCLYIDGKKVIDNDGIHGVESSETRIRLRKGSHEIRVDWFEKSGGEELRLDWAGPGIDPGPIDRWLAMNRDAAPIKPKTEPSPVDPNAFAYDEAKAGQGRQLFIDLGCVLCHVRSEQGSRIEPSRIAPALAQCDPNKGCLDPSPFAPVPNYDLTGIQIESIRAAITAKWPEREQTFAAPLTHTMRSLNCYACHLRDGVGGPDLVHNEFFVSTIPEMGEEGRLPPPLDGVGDKLQENWIRHVVSNGDKSRPYMRTHMPKFGENNAGHLAAILASLDSRNDAVIPTTDEPANRQVAVGRMMVGSGGLGCVSCHTYGQFRSTGIQAIALDTMASRIREDWFHRYLPNPQIYRPGTRMPSGYPDGKSTVTNIYDGDSGKQIAAMWAYLSKGIQGGVPDGITGGMIELKPDTRPVIYRNFIEGVSPRGVAVGYPEKANLCWDANQMCLALIWQDRFIDASKHWIGRGQGNQTPLGGNPVMLERACPIALLDDANSIWPTESSRQRGYRFLGYQLDQQGRPSFRYRTPTAMVEDKPIPVSGEFSGTFRREITVTPVIEAQDSRDPVDGTLYFRAASGNVKSLQDGWYSLEGAAKVRVRSTGTEAITREIDGSLEVLVPIHGPTTITQEIVW